MRWISEVGAADGSKGVAVFGIELGTADGSADEGDLSGMELGADNGTSDGALLGHATVVVVLGSADGATAGTATADLAATAKFKIIQK